MATDLFVKCLVFGGSFVNRINQLVENGSLDQW